MDLFIEESPKTPRVRFIGDAGEFLISGRSIPLDADAFYEPIFKWLSIYAISPNKSIHLQVDLDQYDRASFKHLMGITFILENAGCEVEVDWLKDIEGEE